MLCISLVSTLEIARKALLGERSNVDNVKLCPHAHTCSLHNFFVLLGVTVGGAHAFLSSSLVLISFSVSVFLFLAFGGSIL